MSEKKKQTETKATESKPQKKLPPKEIIMNQVEQLGPGQSLTYQLGKYLWEGFAAFAIVELNPEYPAKGKGKKYILSTDKIVEGKPAGKRARFWDADKPKDIAGWLLERQGELFS